MGEAIGIILSEVGKDDLGWGLRSGLVGCVGGCLRGFFVWGLGLGVGGGWGQVWVFLVSINAKVWMIDEYDVGLECSNIFQGLKVIQYSMSRTKKTKRYFPKNQPSSSTAQLSPNYSIDSPLTASNRYQHHPPLHQYPMAHHNASASQPSRLE